jgi:hypothetical protein
MLNQQRTGGAYPSLRQKLVASVLTEQAVAKALSGLPPDTATLYLCQCLTDEETSRGRRERVTLAVLVLGVIGILALTISSQLITGPTWTPFLIGIALLSTAIGLSMRRFSPLRENALIGLSQVIAEVREGETLVPLCVAAALLDSRLRPWEAQVEGALRSKVAQLLTRLSADEAALLPDRTREFLVAAITDNRHQELTIAALLILGSAGDSAAEPIAERLRASLVETVREAALEYLQAVRGFA